MNIEIAPSGFVFSEPHFSNERFACWSRGYFVVDGCMMWGDDLCRWAVKAAADGLLISSIPVLSGVFQLSIVDRFDNKAIFIQDRWGSYPVFWSHDAGSWRFSDSAEPFLTSAGRMMRHDAVAEILTFGHVMGNKTLVDGVNELIPHHWCSCLLDGFGNIDFKQTHYWTYHLNFPSADFRASSHAFIDLWHQRMKIFADGVQRSGKVCYTPLSAGLDSRLIAFELDSLSVPQINLTFGSGVESREINVASTVSRSLCHTLGHYVMYLNEANFRHLISSAPGPYRLTTAHFAEKDLWFPSHFNHEVGFFFSGHSGDFMAGSHLRTRMKYWKSVDPVIEYIVRFKGTPLGKHLFFNDNEYRDLITASLTECLCGYPDWLNAFMNWDLQQRQRRFIMRSALSQNPQEIPLVVMPFFDYQLFDFFVDLPFEFLLDTKLYRHAQMDHLYRGVSPFDRLPANGRRVKPLISGTVGEYGYKLASLFDRGKKVRMYDETIDWQKISGDFVLPDCLPAKWNVPRFLGDNSRMYYGLSEFTKMFNQFNNNLK
ncbi:MAG: hypothetical protein JXR39_03345 [Marinilabiliaceae bacterium]|nr:hypothetical protein [Marinilabiliaceae bacterium]